MIKYLELTAPEKSEFRQAKILSIEVSEGDIVSKGDTLFIVKSGSNEIDLPASMDGKVIEIIVLKDENISLLTPLILLETEVEGSTASTPIENGNKAQPVVKTKQKKETEEQAQKKSRKKKKAKKKTKNTKKKVHQQQNLDLDLDSDDTTDDENFIEQDITSDSFEIDAMNAQQIKVPDIGTDEAKVIEILVKVGDRVDIDDPLVTLESDKASMDIPSTAKGSITSIAVQVDDDVSEGTLILELSLETSEPIDESKSADINEPETRIEESSLTPEPSAVNSSPVNAEIVIPDIGGDSAKVIEILVEVGQTVAVEDPLITLESDKASMDVPSTVAGVVTKIEVGVDQEVNEGIVFAIVETVETAVEDPSSEHSSSKQPIINSDNSSVVDIVIPDIGGDSAKVIEILVVEGQQVEVEFPLVTLESDKATMDVPTTVAGTIQSIEVVLDQDVSEGVVVAKILSTSQPESAPSSQEKPAEPKKQSIAPRDQTSPTPLAPAPVTGKAHASPSIRRFARELGVDLTNVGGTGRKGRIVKADVKAFVKNIMLTGGSAPAAGSGIPEIPAIDFSKFGEIDTQPLNKIKKLTAKNLHRAWLNVPHVTHHDESNVSDLEVFRKELNKEYAEQNKDIKLSPLAFIVKAVVGALRTYPQFNSSLSPDSESIVFKKYIHIGIAVETPNGLVVPVIRDADKLSVSELASTMGELARKARDKKLSPADMSGASFTISSLGGIGGTGFTPIVNAPEVAILGVSRNKIQPVWNGEKFEPASILPLSLSYDHRIIDGAEAARFTAHIAAALEDVRRLTV